MGTKHPSIGRLEVPSARDEHYLQTLEQWGALPEVLAIQDAATLIGSMCGQNPAALRKLITDAVVNHELRFWGLSHHGGWVESMFRVFYPYEGKPRVRLDPNGDIKNIEAYLKTEGARLHVEATGVNPADILELLQKRGRKIPDGLRSLLRKHEATPAADEKSTPAKTEDWKEKIEAQAAVIWRRERAKGCNPTKNSIKKDLATWARNNNIKTKTKINPDEKYIARHVLQNWTPPDD